MYRPGKVLKFSGGHQPEIRTERICFSNTDDVSEADAQWAAITGPDQVQARNHSTAVVLPDGTVLAVNGNHGPHGDAESDDNARLETELFDPEEDRWCRLADSSERRQYHSNAFLLPDGRVVSAGSGNVGCLGETGESGCIATERQTSAAASQRNHFNAEFYSPPYLFWGPRPAVPEDGIEGIPKPTLDYGAEFQVAVENEGAVGVTSVNLVRLSATTHNNNMDSRFVPLNLAGGDPDDGLVRASAPRDGTVAPPGYYMLFVISDAGVPSIGRYVRLGEEGSGGDRFLHTGVDRDAGIRLSCRRPVDAPVSLSDLNISLETLCRAIPTCVGQQQTLSVWATLVTSEPSGNPSFGGTISVDTRGNISVDYDDTAFHPGPGEHMLQLCIEDAFNPSRADCVDQPLSLEAPLAVGVDSSGYETGDLAAEVRDRFVPLRHDPDADCLEYLGDDDFRYVNLPDGFEFPYDGGTYGTMTVHSNGGVTMGYAGFCVGYQNTELPDPLAPDVAVYWDDLVPSWGDGGVYTKLDGDRFIVSWEGVPHYGSDSSNDSVSFQAHFYRDGSIEMHYEDTEFAAGDARNGAASATIGIQASGIDTHMQVVHNSGLLGDGTIPRALRLVPHGEGPGECIVPEPHLPDWMPCATPSLVFEPVQVVDGTGGPPPVEAPTIPGVCSSYDLFHVEGEVVEAGPLGGPLAPVEPPIPVVGGSAMLGPGSYTVEWSIKDEYGDVIDGPAPQRLDVVGPPALSACEVAQTHENCCLDETCCPAGTWGVRGTSWNDALAGAGSAICLVGYEGNDTISAGGGSDWLIGAEGDDAMQAGDGPDVVSGGPGADQLEGGGGADHLFGGDDDDTLLGGSGADFLDGSFGNDVLAGGNDDDQLVGGPGADVISGQGGDDVAWVYDLCEVSSGETIDGGTGTDTLVIPVTEAQLESMGVTVAGFESILVDASLSCESECTAPCP